MVLHSESKRGYDKVCGWRVGRENLLSFLPSCFSSSHSILISDLAARRPESSAFVPGSRSGPEEIWLKKAVTSSRTLSPPSIKGSQNLCLVFICQTGHLGTGLVHGFWALLGRWKSIACLEVGPQRGFAWETFGGPSTFKLWQAGHNTGEFIQIFWQLRCCVFKWRNLSFEN